MPFTTVQFLNHLVADQSNRVKYNTCTRSNKVKSKNEFLNNNMYHSTKHYQVPGNKAFSKSVRPSWARWHTTVVLALRSLRLDCQEFNYIVQGYIEKEFAHPACNTVKLLNSVSLDWLHPASSQSSPARST